MSGTSRLGEISSLEAVVERLKRHPNAVIGNFWNVVAALGHLEAATQGVVLGGQAV